MQYQVAPKKFLTEILNLENLEILLIDEAEKGKKQ